MSAKSFHGNKVAYPIARDVITPATATDLGGNLFPTRARNQAHAGFIFCLPAQPTRAQTSSRDDMTPAAATNLGGNLLPTRARDQAHTILCLPAQSTRAQTSGSRPILTKPPSRDHSSSSRITESLALNGEERSTTFWTLFPTCRML
ncbi:chromatin structure-remodeling complex protein SYD-like [Dorcoceras hygrometricum]|uniref:Chromatin structure-remodeling complex protein SYD-like n=1 Tax=Dorcoceras hygrometricum TaxID=472368 RepID=A0A2Z7CT27_9LAMI|nr:chromatin structure-remodeling complex protein SYD-like [Dorcoceras hygrometricum]